MYHVILGKGFVGTHLSHYFKQNNIDHKIFSQSELDYTDPNTFKDFLDLDLSAKRYSSILEDVL